MNKATKDVIRTEAAMAKELDEALPFAAHRDEPEKKEGAGAWIAEKFEGISTSLSE